MGITKINKIEMKGFKSFANKVELLFGDKFNCILGPNGSGKSNVLDALCFVLGKSSAKGLRAEKSANLIYNGGKKKKPAKDGIVSIYFDNSNKVFPDEGEEIKISRIIRQTGASVYKINDKTMTRQQVLDMLSMVKINPDGHNIILQGDITHLIEMTPNERRQIVEEIAGISIYEEKKNKALRELQRVEEKMNEAEIILTERKTYLKELKSERDQAQKFKDLDDKIKRNKATLLHDKITQRNDNISKIDKKTTEFKAKIKVFQDEIDVLQKDIKKRKIKIEDINAEVERRGEKEQVALHKEVEALKVDLAVKEQRIATVTTEIEKVGERQSELAKAKDELDEKIGRIDTQKTDANKRIKRRVEEVAQLDKKITAFKQKNKIGEASDIDKRMEEIDKVAEKLQEKILKMREEQQNILRDKDKTEIRIQGHDEKIEKVLSVEKENKKAIADLKQHKSEFKNAALELSKELNESSSVAAQLENARQKVLSRKEELGKLKTRHSAIRENVAGGLAIQKILELKKKERGIHGTVSDLGTVSATYSLALEVAAGARIKSLIVDTDVVAAKCIKYLRDKRLGVATFLPLNKLRPPNIENITMKGQGVHGLAINLVKYKPQYKKVFEYVFSNTLVVEDVDTARRLGIGSVRMVTLAGDLIEKSGAMQGGFRKKEGMRLGFQEKELTESIERIEAEIGDLESVIHKLEIKKREVEANIDRLREFKANKEGEILKLEKMLHLESDDLEVSKTEIGKLKSELKQLDRRIDEITNEISTQNRELANLKIEKQGLRDKITELRSPRLLAELNTFDEKKQELQQEIMDIKGELKNLDSEVTNVLAPEKESVAKILKQHEKEVLGFEKESKDLEVIIKKNNAELKTKEKAEKEFYAQFKELFTQRSKISNEITKFETQIQGKNDSVREFEHKQNANSLESAKYKAELSGLVEEYKSFEGVPLFKGKGLDEIKREINQFEKIVENLGAVNMKALEIYDKVESEYQRLMEKKNSLVKEREDVLVMINEIDAKKSDLFMRSFDVLTKNFQNIFKNLSSKGEAFLNLEDKNDPFNGGLEIKVRLVGKKFLDIRSLSGGEKTLTALAFLFAIQEHEPASFYVLDEVDAALDKRNSEMLAELLKDYAIKAQYIIISHNDQIISEADRLYGVSMTDHGMSKVTSLKI
ncbi:MAG: chromosome segregation protein SMC [Nanoarchaeota archaeon]|nr:chromosome segregation protein SMC [Nanoarchaeota archaeon]